MVVRYQPVSLTDPFMKVGIYSSVAYLLDLDICDEILRLITLAVCRSIIPRAMMPEELFRLYYLEAAYDQPIHWLRYADAHATEKAPRVRDTSIDLNLHRAACTYGQRDAHRHAASYVKPEDGLVVLRRECRMAAHQVNERLEIENNRQLRDADWTRLFHLQLTGPLQKRMRMRMAECQERFREPVSKPLLPTEMSSGVSSVRPETRVVLPQPIAANLTELIDGPSPGDDPTVALRACLGRRPRSVQLR